MTNVVFFTYGYSLWVESRNYFYNAYFNCNSQYRLSFIIQWQGSLRKTDKKILKPKLSFLSQADVKTAAAKHISVGLHSVQWPIFDADRSTATEHLITGISMVP